MYEERKRQNRFRYSTLTERLQVNAHPYAQHPTIKNSIIDWVQTFKTLPDKPETVTDFINSGALYFIMEEIEPEYFPELPYTIINKKVTQHD